MEWALASLAVTLVGYAAIAGRIAGTSVPAPMVFTGCGLLLGSETLGSLTSPLGEDAQTLAEATLATVLFADASRESGASRRRRPARQRVAERSSSGDHPCGRRCAAPYGRGVQ